MKPPRLARLLRRAARRLRGTPTAGLILMYHRVRDATEDPYRSSISPALLDAHLRLIRDRFEVRPLSQVSEVAVRPWAVLTFDDGYADSFTAALGLLEKHDLPATFFVTSQPAIAGHELWWDDILRYPAHRQVYRRLIHRAPAEQARELARLRGTDVVPPAREEFRLLTLDELRLMSRHRLVEIGAHTANHAALPALSAAEQAAEIFGGKKQLEEVIGKPVVSFAYPYGWFNPQSRRCVVEAGFERACTVEHEGVVATTDPFALPRFEVRGWPAEGFARQLERWLRWF